MAKYNKKDNEFERYRKGNKNISIDSKEEVKKENPAEEEATKEKKAESKKSTVEEEIVLLISGLITLLLYLSILGWCGFIGKPIRFIIFFLTGIFGFFLPAAFMAVVVYYIISKRKELAVQSIYFFVGFALAICSLLHVLFVDKFSNFFKNYDPHGGGFLGAIIGSPLRALCGRLAALLILVAIILVILMMLTKKAILSMIYQKNKEVYRKTAEKRRINKENKARIELERNATDGRDYYNRMMNGENVVSGPIIYSANEYYTSNESTTNPNNGRRESFVDVLKRGGAEIRGENSYVPTVEDEIRVHNISEHEYTPNPDMDMMEITFDQSTGSIDDTNNTYTNESIYQQELRRKFGDKTIEEVVYQSNENIQSTREFENETTVRGEVVNDVNPTNSIDELKSNVSNGNFGMSVDTRTEGKSGSAAVFARGDVKTISPSGPSIVSENVKREQQKAQEPKPDPTAPRRIPINKKRYSLPPMNLLNKPAAGVKGTSEKELRENGRKLQDVLKSFGVNVTVTDICCGPSVIRYELQPEVGVKVSKITSLSDDIKLNLAAADIRIEAPIPGKAAVGIEVPNKNKQTVYLSSLFMSEDFKNNKGKLPFAVGKDITGNVIIGDLAKMPHMLIAGTTGSGKSVFVNSIIFSILYKQKPEDCKLIMIDPKMVEFPIYNGIPHLLIPVVTDPKKASAALNWAVMEMTDRYNKFAAMQVRDISSYNEKIDAMNEKDTSNDGCMYERLPQIVIIIDELADLMMVASNEVDEYICRLAQLARAAGIHMIIATQRPSVNVVTGTIKANIPSRVALSLSSQIDSRTIIDMAGAEKLLGNGDMLYYPTGYTKPLRIQGAYVSDEERENLVAFLKRNSVDEYNSEIIEKIESAQTTPTPPLSGGDTSASATNSMYDEYIYQAGLFIIEKEKASIGMLQRQFKIGFNRAARIMDQLCDLGAVGPEEGTKPRQILMNLAQFEALSESEGLK